MGVGTGWLGVWVHWGQLGQHGPQFRLQHGGLLGWPGLLLRDLSGVLKDHPQPPALGFSAHPNAKWGFSKVSPSQPPVPRMGLPLHGPP